MIVTKLYGGLGNQMFQYAAGIGLSKRLSSSLFVDTSWFEEMKTNPYIVSRREYELSVFGIEPLEMGVIQKLSQLINKPRIFKEKTIRYQTEFENLEGNIILDGQWLSYRYFDRYSQDIASTFKFPRYITTKNRAMLGEIGSASSVAVHVRRADYVTDKNTNVIHGVLPIGYYEKAAKYLIKNTRSPIFYIFSDDIDWCKKNLQLGGETIYVNHNHGQRTFEDMRLMTACKHNIIANSSFSWWPAWLNPHAEKMIIAPKKWFADRSFDSSDIVPKGWIRI